MRRCRIWCNGLRPRLQNLRFNSPLQRPLLAFGSEPPTMSLPQRSQTMRKTPGPLNVAATPLVNEQPRMPISPMAAAAPANTHPTKQDAGAAPEVGTAASGDADLHRVIALSAAPAPPAAEVSVPQGNAAAKIAISPDGKQPGVPGGSEHAAPGNGGTGGHPDSAGGTNGAGGATHGSGGGGNGKQSLPAAISITGGSNNGTGVRWHRFRRLASRWKIESEACAFGRFAAIFSSSAD